MNVDWNIAEAQVVQHDMTSSYGKQYKSDLLSTGGMLLLFLHVHVMNLH